MKPLLADSPPSLLKFAAQQISLLALHTHSLLNTVSFIAISASLGSHVRLQSARRLYSQRKGYPKGSPDMNNPPKLLSHGYLSQTPCFYFQYSLSFPLQKIERSGMDRDIIQPHSTTDSTSPHLRQCCSPSRANYLISQRPRRDLATSSINSTVRMKETSPAASASNQISH